MRQLGVVMDPIASIKPVKDTTLAMLLEAQRRGYALHYYEIPDLSIRDGRAMGRRRSLQVRDDPTDWYTLGAAEDAALAELDVLLMRKDPPVEDAFLYATHVLSRAEAEGVQVVNRPDSLRNWNEKLAISGFAHCTAPTLVSMEMARLQAFVDEHADCILKPLDGMGGAGIFRVGANDPNRGSIVETLTQNGRRAIMAQRYISAVTEGDKRILMIDGEPVDVCLARIPKSGETRANLAAGGRGEGRPLSDRDRWIAEQVGPTLRQHGLRFVGLDVIGDYLTEINVTSPTCVRELDAQYGINIAGLLFDAIESS
ncbi:glutathione synthase [Abyssibacter profundi]|uniref:Glutathione synthetase n=1 Tax=Abyssibacter profundi TaxID=2182787 RepID=A0A363UIY5_9GAMM|nr:glutathione synthase [Abyssibacter profundi]MBV59696.1 glutathione synthase [Nevskiales bacterium]PWN55386.1 glutathione synthase [Abyssibacter profundi]